MLSERKVLIRSAEIFALCGSICMLAAATAIVFGYLSATRVESLLALFLALSFGVFFIAVLLLHEFAQAIHGKSPSPFEENKLSLAETKELVRWCPGLIKQAFFIAVVVMVTALSSVGAVEWSSGQLFTDKEAIGFPLFLASFMLVALPILASASRMPGRFDDHFSPKPDTTNDT